MYTHSRIIIGTFVANIYIYTVLHDCRRFNERTKNRFVLFIRFQVHIYYIYLTICIIIPTRVNIILYYITVHASVVVKPTEHIIKIILPPFSACSPLPPHQHEAGLQIHKTSHITWYYNIV